MVQKECASNDYLKTESLRIRKFVLPTNEELSSIYSLNQSLILLVEKTYQDRVKDEFNSVAKSIKDICKSCLSPNCLSVLIAAEIIDSQLQSLASEREDDIWKKFCYNARISLITLLENSVTTNQDLSMLVTLIYNQLKKVTFPWQKNRFLSQRPLLSGFALFTIMIIIKSIMGSQISPNADSP